MATSAIPVDDRRDSVDRGPNARPTVPGFRRLLAPLASLRLTVALLAMGVFIVLVGTLAQAEMGIETVVNEFFRVRPWGPTLGFAWVPFQVFFPESFFKPQPQVGGGFWFPGGWLIGLLMFANLLAAHAIRFTTPVRGIRLAAGLGVIALGAAITWLVVASGSESAGGLQATPLLSWDVLWRLFQVHVVLLGAANLGIAGWLHWRSEGIRRNAWIWTAATPITVGLAIWALVVPDVSESSMRILWQLIKATMASLVLLAGCWIVFRKRAGIVLLHAGIGLLMISELLVGLLAVETRMSLGEGETKSWADDIRVVELAVTDPSHPEHDVVTRFPASRLVPGAVLSHESIPFQIRVDQFFKNATLVDANEQPAEENLADSGSGRVYIAKETREIAGASGGGEVDQPAAYVTLLTGDGQEPLGTYLLSSTLAMNDIADTVRVGEKEWWISLRFKRDYKPYAITLIDVRKDDYVGTDTPKNYSSDIRVVSEELGADFERKVWMNNPLRFAGETVYQSGYHRDRLGREYTTFQIVRNTGWMLPYVACMIVVIGMTAQFLVTLSRFVARRTEARSVAKTEDAPDAIETASNRGRLAWILPTIVVLLFTGWLASKFAPPRTAPGQADLVAFGELPIASHGRVKPIDTVARDALKTLSNNRQTFKTAEGREPAIRWLLDFIASPQAGAEHRVVRIDNDELLSVLELPRDREGFMYSTAEIIRAIPALSKRAGEVRAKSQRGELLSANDRAVLELERKVGVIDLLLSAFQPDIEGTLRQGVAGLEVYKQRYTTLKHGDPAARPAIPSRNPPLAVYYKDDPFREAGKRDEYGWETLAHAQLVEALKQLAATHGESRHEPDPGVAAWNRILDSWNKGDVSAFNAAVKRYRTSLEAEPPTGYHPKRVDFEAYFNHAEPFYYLMFPYVVAALLAGASWLGFSQPLNRTAFWLGIVTFTLHTLALIGRIYISGRPPVTNLYGSAVFVGWAGVAFGLGLERVYRLGFGNVLAGVMGAAGLLIAHGLAKDGSDTFAVLQAVLDTQFWLATHVVIINLGYAAVAAAGMLGVLYILLGVATPLLSRNIGSGARAQTVGESLTRMTYGMLCFGLLFSFFGTVLGGLWADDSWGRFWGWDPKENGALIIVLWAALVLHARWGGMVKDRGIALLAVGGNIAVSWSWFGTNQLGVGLHSYGFTDGMVLALTLFVTSQLAVIAAGCLPKSMWMSERSHAA